MKLGRSMPQIWLLGSALALAWAGCRSAGTSTDGACSPACTPAFWSKTICYFPFWDNMVTAHTARRCAHEAMRQQCDNFGQNYSADFRSGYTRAFIDVASGGLLVVPAVAPPRYWNAFYRSAAGKHRAEEWLNGYEYGLQTASSNCISDLRYVTASGKSLIQTVRPYSRPDASASGYPPAYGGSPLVQQPGLPSTSHYLPVTGPVSWPCATTATPSVQSPFSIKPDFDSELRGAP